MKDLLYRKLMSGPRLNPERNNVTRALNNRWRWMRGAGALVLLLTLVVAGSARDGVSAPTGADQVIATAALDAIAAA